MKKTKAKRNNFRGGAEYKALSLFIVGTIGFLLLVYVGFGLVMMTIKADRLMHSKNIGKRVPSDVGMIKRDTRSDAGMGVNKNNEKVNVIVKEVFGKINNVNNDVVTINTKIYGGEEKSVRLKLTGENEGGIFKYETDNDGKDVEVAMKASDLKEGMYVGVKLPVEILLSEIEKDLIYVDNIVVDTQYQEEDQK